MPQAFVAPASVPQPWALAGAGTGAASASASADILLTWQDSSTNTIHAGTLALSAYDSAETVDDVAFVWLLVVKQSHDDTALWVKELDRATLDTVLGGASWATPWRLCGGELIPVPQTT